MNPNAVPNEAVGEAGETLVEIVIAVAILGLVFAIVLGGLATSEMTSTLHRTQSTAQTILRSYAEAVEGPVSGYSACGPYTKYNPGSTGIPSSVFAVPPGYSAGVVTGTFAIWNGTAFQSLCPVNGDAGAQEMSLQVRSNDGRVTEQVQVIKRLP